MEAAKKPAAKKAATKKPPASKKKSAKAKPKRDPTRIDAEPTKDFFISMLVKDIELIPAITDLVDNSLDGARRIRGKKRFDGLKVKVVIKDDRFEISDNCGGIELKSAREYAFRFGRPRKAEPVKHSVGQFGVGMKRALFKLGKAFAIESTSKYSTFSMSEDVQKWARKKEWAFRFDEMRELPKGKKFTDSKIGTRIEVTKLHEGVAGDFGTDQFLADLRAELARRHQLGIAKGLDVQVNGTSLEPAPVHFAVSKTIKPAQKKFSPDGVAIEIDAGIADSDGAAGGWYVFCNDRLILDANKTSATAWGWRSGPTRIPNFHAQFARFRGYVFFEADDSSKLPWNTTKTNVDLDDPVYREAQREMVAMGRPVVDFLNDLSEEINATRGGDDIGPLEKAVAVAEKTLKTYDKATYAETFVRPEAKPIAVAEPTTSTITYVKERKKIDRLKRLFKVSSNREVGEKTFDEFYADAIGDDDDG